MEITCAYNADACPDQGCGGFVESIVFMQVVSFHGFHEPFSGISFLGMKQSRMSEG
jgi:hypothetical protein